MVTGFNITKIEEYIYQKVNLRNLPLKTQNGKMFNSKLTFTLVNKQYPRTPTSTPTHNCNNSVDTPYPYTGLGN